MMRRSLPVPREHAEQAAVIAWFDNYAVLRWPWLRLDDGRPARYAVPNGGLRGKRTAAILAAEGVSSGVPDLHIPALHLQIEMKRTKGGRTSDEQKSWHAYLRACGDRVEVCRGADEAIAVITAAAGVVAKERES